MDPCELNVLVTALTNHLFTSLSEEDFTCMSVFLSELSKAMFTTELYRDLCKKKRKECDASGT